MSETDPDDNEETEGLKRPFPIIFIVFIGFFLSLAEFGYYLGGSYTDTIMAVELSPVEFFFSTGGRFVCRLAYPVAFVGLWFMRRWGVYLALGAWLVQLLPMMAWVITEGAKMGPLYASILQLIIFLACVWPYWKQLEPKGSVKVISIYVIAASLIHSLFFTFILLGPKG